MDNGKITLEELANLGDGEHIDLDVLHDNNDDAYALIKEEIEDFVSKPQPRAKTKKMSFFETVPSTELKKSIETVMKTRNIKEEIAIKHAQYEFDAKMARIKKIKSKTYRRLKRRDKLRKEEALENSSEDESASVSISDSTDEKAPIISFNNQIEKSVSEEESSSDNAVGDAFELPGFEGNEKDFLKEKAEIVDSDAPKLIEHSLPGWGDWAGEGIEFHKTKFNTVVEKKDGIEQSDRQDFKKENVIINEHTEINDKYKSTIPYGYSYKQYKMKLQTPISLETSSLRAFNRFVKISKEEESVPGKNIEPKEFRPEYL